MILFRLRRLDKNSFMKKDKVCGLQGFQDKIKYNNRLYTDSIICEWRLRQQSFDSAWVITGVLIK